MVVLVVAVEVVLVVVVGLVSRVVCSVNLAVSTTADLVLVSLYVVGSVVLTVNVDVSETIVVGMLVVV